MSMNETTLRGWYLISFTDAPPPKNRVLWGIIEADSRGLKPGSWVCSSLVIDQIDDKIFITKNTCYTTQGLGEEISLPVKALIELRQGVSPEEWQVYENFRRQGYKIEIESGQ